MYDIREVSADEILNEANLVELFGEHWHEVALNKHVMVMKPDLERYLALAAQGRLLVLAAYHDGELAGYSVNFVMPHLHYADLVICSNDLLFIAQEHRKGRLGIKLLRETEKQAKARGAQLMLWHAKPNTNLNELLPLIGYGVQDVIYSREI